MTTAAKGGKADRLLTRAMADHQAGRVAEAEQVYDQVLRRRPGHAQALHLKGVARVQQGDPALGVDLLTRAVAANPDHVEARVNLGRTLAGLGRLDEALPHLDWAARRRPDFAEAQRLLGEVAHALGRPETALPALRAAVARTPLIESTQTALIEALLALDRAEDAVAAAARGHCPTSPRIGSLLAAALGAAGRYGEAVPLFEARTQDAPEDAAAWSNLGAARIGAGDLDAGKTALRRALELDPSQPDATNNLATALMWSGDAPAAVGVLEAGLARHADDPRLLNALGNALREAGRPDEAQFRYLAASQAAPGFADPLNNLGVLAKAAGRVTEAVAHFEDALRARPAHAEAWSNLAAALPLMGRHREALEAHEQAARAAPNDPNVLSNLLMGLNYQETLSPEWVFARHRDWNARFAAGRARTEHRNDPDPERPLTVGFVSGDLKAHAVARFLEPLLEARNGDRIRVRCYANQARDDEVTGRLRGLSDGWRAILALDHTQAASAVEADAVDILVDLSGHTAGGRPSLFALRPAPVQATWLGYPNTTGLDAIDIRITDAIADPEPEADRYASERLVRLPTGFLCYRPPEEAPPPERCGDTRDAVVFGSFNTLAKLTDGTVALWARVLDAVPGSRLLLKSPAVDDEAVAAATVARFAAHGMGERVSLLGHVSSRAAHLRAYGRIDVALDPLTYNGTTTTCEALWMGVPVVSLRGRSHAARVGASLLTHAGLSDWIAEDEPGFVRIAQGLASARETLSTRGCSLRTAMAASPLMDGPAFARGFEDALRAAWRVWCGGR